MNRSANAVTMIERQIAQIGTSQYPDAEFVKGMIQANYAHGFIDERQLVDFEDRANEAASTRRLALRRTTMGRRLGALNLLHGGAQ
ncbi:hypothetical protein RYA07_27595 [Pseudomonas syringae pv. actinidiae]|uniref:hypothetical protein n=1 Tax=Pseudomonas syringae TaxID=317 RepID=UPI000D78A7F7|nr:hypothetical protein [Pseudomonas syringae]MDU8429209.1 hypothetical protein [Pseudomonas syringae pv. actinidifoliorum]MBL3827592.1 hypothetical protein [Pseudomonas syringae pv. theae]MBL3836838.1 hypothetical protein [Pseudomonas syringae pv. theae]MBL3866836.1 hypothetical protein [Pseudomonas syringae pv. theae]MDU8492054.1 hypothetical protein [Pseudomonas syringae pv. actinidiae]